MGQVPENPSFFVTCEFHYGDTSGASLLSAREASGLASVKLKVPVFAWRAHPGFCVYVGPNAEGFAVSFDPVVSLFGEDGLMS